MSERLPPCPTPPDWRVDWDFYDHEYAWIRNLAGCPQSPIHHAEGDVWIHVRMVCEELAALPAFRSLDPVTRRVLFTAALLHDVGKPDCTRQEPDGSITSRGHSRRGSILARQILWRCAVPFVLREQIAALVRYHQIPYFLLEREDPRRLALEISQSVSCEWLTLLAEADVRGRLCQDRQRLLDNVALFGEYSREEGCLTRPREFASDLARFLYFHQEGRYPDAPAYEEYRCEVTLLSGLPGSGKDHWARQHLGEMPIISLDEVRSELDVSPTDEQGTVLNEARERARQMLRQRQSFAWNATNLSRQLRRGLIEFFAGYQARVRLVYLEVPESVLFAQNRQRTAVVPQAVMERLLDRWEVPDRTEAHQVDYVVRE